MLNYFTRVEQFKTLITFTSRILGVLITVISSAAAAKEPLENLPYPNMQCNYMMAARALKARGVDPHFSLSNYEALYNKYDKSVAHRFARTPWERSLYPFSRSRITVPVGLFRGGVPPTPTPLELAWQKYISAKVPISMHKDYGLRFDQVVTKNKVLSDQDVLTGSVFSTAAAVLCSEIIPLLSSSKCSNEFTSLIELSQYQIRLDTQVTEYVMVPNGKELIDFLDDRRYEKGLSATALKLFYKYREAAYFYQNYKESQPDPNVKTPVFPANARTSLYTDLVESFMESGLTEAEAIDGAWSALGLIGTRGPNLTKMRFVPLDEDPMNRNFDMMRFISTAISLIDHYTSGEFGYIYSMPPGIQGTCNTGKSYHFLMSAYLAREITKKHKDPSRAAATVFTMSKGYNSFMRAVNMYGERPATNAKDFKDKLYQTENTFPDFSTPSGQVVTVDLVYGAAGAVYGAQSVGQAQGPVIDIDRVVSVMLGQPTGESKSTVLALLQPVANSLTEYVTAAVALKSYIDFDSMYEPNRAFKDVQKQLNGKK